MQFNPKNTIKKGMNSMRSDSVKKGVQQAPHRSLFNALGMTEEEMSKPLVGIVSSYNEIVPGHMNLDKIVDAVKLGVAAAGGTPISTKPKIIGYNELLRLVHYNRQGEGYNETKKPKRYAKFHYI